MKKNIFLSIIVVLFALSNLNAKTIWLFNESKNNPWSFTQMLLDDLKDSKIGKMVKYTEKNPDLINGDIVIWMVFAYGTCGNDEVYPITFIITRFTKTDNKDDYFFLAAFNLGMLYSGNNYQLVRDAKNRILENIN